MSEVKLVDFHFCDSECALIFQRKVVPFDEREECEEREARLTSSGVIKRREWSGTGEWR